MGKNYFSDIILQISNTFSRLDEAVFDRLSDDCYKAIKEGHKIIASGLGKNVPLCEKFVGTMLSLGLPAAFLHTNSAMHGDLGNIQNGDVVLILSKSGNTSESIMLANYIIKWDCKKWLLSYNDGGELAKILDNKLLLPLQHEGDMWNIVPHNSSSCYLILLQGLAMFIAEKYGVVVDDFKRNHPGGAIGKKLINVN